MNGNRPAAWLPVRANAWLPLLIVVLFGAVLRLYLLDGASLWYDEAASIFGARQVDSNWTFLKPGESHVVPLYAVSIRAWMWLLENAFGLEPGSAATDFWMRLPSVAASVAAIPLAYLIGRRLIGSDRAGILAALLIAASPFNLFYAQELRPHSLYALLVMAAFYASFVALEDGGRRWWVSSVVLTALTLYIYYFACWYIISMNLYVCLQFRRYRSSLLKWALSQAAAAVLALPPILMALFVYQVHSSASEHWFPHPGVKLLAISVKTYLAGYSPRTSLYWIVFLAGAALAVYGIVAVRKRRHVMVVLVVMAYAPLLLQLLFWHTRDFSFYTHRIQLAYVFPHLTLIAAAIASFPYRMMRLATAASILLLMSPMIADVYSQNLHPVWEHRLGPRYKVDNRAAARFIEDRMGRGDVIGHSSTMTLGPFIAYYLQRPQAALAFTDEERQGFLSTYPDKKMWGRIGLLPVRIEDLVEGAERMWYVESWWEQTDPIPLIAQLRAWLDHHAVRVSRTRFDGVNVYLYDLRTEPYLDASVNTASDNGYGQLPIYLHDDEIVNPESLRPEFRPHVSAIDIPVQSILYFSQDSVAQRGNPSMPRAARPPQYGGGFAANTLSFVSNTDAEGRRARMYQVREHLPAIAFHRDRASGAWRPTNLFYGRVCMIVRLRPEERAAVMRKQIAIEPGGYAAFLRIHTESGEPDTGVDIRLDLARPDGDHVKVGTVNTARPDVQPGWHWLRLGEFSTPGPAETLTLTAVSPDARPEAAAAVMDIAFTPAGRAEAFEPVEVRELQGRSVHISLEPYHHVPELPRILAEVVTPEGAVIHRLSAAMPAADRDTPAVPFP